MSQVQCQIEIPKLAGEEAANLTVGREFLLHCQGEWPELNQAKLELRLDEADQYKLKLLDFKFTSKTEADLKVTSYKAGQHELKTAQLVDADHSVVLGDLQFTVSSVMDPKEPPQEPFGPFGPLSLSLPFWYPLTLALLVLVVISWVSWRLRRRQQRRKLLAEMNLDQYVQDPLGQFFQVVRKAQRQYSFFSGAEATKEETKQFIQDIGGAYKIYLARQLQVPTLTWSARRILADIKKRHPDFYEEFRGGLKQSLVEIVRAESSAASSAKVSGKDCQQLLDLLRHQVDRVEVFLRKERAS